MPWWTWLALGIFLAVGVGAAITAFVLSLRTFRLVRETQESLLGAVETLAADAEALATRAERVNAQVEEVEQRVHDAQWSAERFGVLTWALGDSLDAVRRIRQAVPRK